MSKIISIEQAQVGRNIAVVEKEAQIKLNMRKEFLAGDLEKLSARAMNTTLTDETTALFFSFGEVIADICCIYRAEKELEVIRGGDCL